MQEKVCEYLSSLYGYTIVPQKDAARKRKATSNCHCPRRYPPCLSPCRHPPSLSCLLSIVITQPIILVDAQNHLTINNGHPASPPRLRLASCLLVIAKYPFVFAMTPGITSSLTTPMAIRNPTSSLLRQPAHGSFFHVRSLK